MLNRSVSVSSVIAERIVFTKNKIEPLKVTLIWAFLRNSYSDSAHQVSHAHHPAYVSAMNLEVLCVLFPKKFSVDNELQKRV